MSLVYEDEELGVLSILITAKDEDRIHITAKYHDYTDKIIDEARVLIDRKNKLIWIENELDYFPKLEKVIRELIII